MTEQPTCDGTNTCCGIYPNCENCNEYAGCYVYGNGGEEREYRDYNCSDGACTYSITGTQWLATGNTRNKDDGTICGCTANNTLKACYEGNYTDTGICNSTICGADAACDGKQPWEACGADRRCNKDI